MVKHNTLGLAIADLIKQKSERDNAKFTVYKLSKATNIDSSRLHRIIAGEILSPTPVTLSKIVDFFKSDGFNISVDKLLNWDVKQINIEETGAIATKKHTIPLVLLENIDIKIGTTEAELNIANANNLLAIAISTKQPPFFSPGSIFVIDQNKAPSDESLVVFKQMNNSNSLPILAKYKLNNKHKESFTQLSDNKIITETEKYQIIGVVIHIIVKTN